MTIDKEYHFSKFASIVTGFVSFFIVFNLIWLILFFGSLLTLFYEPVSRMSARDNLHHSLPYSVHQLFSGLDHAWHNSKGLVYELQ